MRAVTLVTLSLWLRAAVALPWFHKQAPLIKSDTLKVPGSSPAKYIGDPTHDLLVIEALDIDARYDNFGFIYNVSLSGEITDDIGPRPKIRLSISLNGTDQRIGENVLCDDGTPGDLGSLHIKQNNATVCPPHKGTIGMWVFGASLYDYIQAGDYTVRAQMWTTNGTRMTDVEGTMFIKGTKPKDDGVFGSPSAFVGTPLA